MTAKRSDGWRIGAMTVGLASGFGGLVLFAVTLVVNLAADLVVKGIRNERTA